jgi:asparagine synthase (glutamine-hydrolysing)
MKIPFDSYYQSRTFNVFRFSESPMSSLYSKEFAETLNKEHSNDVVRKFLTSSVNGINGDRVNRMLYVDTKTWLPDDLLLKADKMTMANSIELRVPFLDHKLLEFAASLPGEYKVHGLSTKYIAKRALQNRIPREIRERKKVGFPVPYALWLRTDLKEWLRDVLLDSKSLSRGYFQKRAIEKLLSDNVESGKYSKELFSLTTLELWHRTFLRPARVL